MQSPEPPQGGPEAESVIGLPISAPVDIDPVATGVGHEVAPDVEAE